MYTQFLDTGPELKPIAMIMQNIMIQKAAPICHITFHWIWTDGLSFRQTVPQNKRLFLLLYRRCMFCQLLFQVSMALDKFFLKIVILVTFLLATGNFLWITFSLLVLEVKIYFKFYSMNKTYFNASDIDISNCKWLLLNCRLAIKL